MIKKRGQTSVEHFLHVTWSVFFIIIVLGVLTHYGIIDPQRLLPERCHLGRELPCTDFIITNKTNASAIQILNGLGKNIAVTDTRITHPKGMFYCLPVGVSPTTPAYVNIGEQRTIKLDCNLDYIGEKKRIKGVLSLNYHVIETGLMHNIEGYISSSIE